MKKPQSVLILVVVVIIIIAAAFWFYSANSQPGELDTFAQCLGEKQVKFFGAFWCPHCQDQKSLFGKSAKKLPYIECSTPDGNSQLSACEEENITQYPTWEFADGSREERVLSLQELSEKTGCELPL